MIDISVIVPLGPFPRTAEYLGELLDSLYQQTLRPAEVVIIDDGAHIDRPLCESHPAKPTVNLVDTEDRLHAKTYRNLLVLLK